MSMLRCLDTYMVSGEIPWARASARTKGLNELPACRWAWVARLNLTLSKSDPPTIALTAPVAGSTETRAAEGSPASGFTVLSTALFASSWRCGSRVVLLLGYVAVLEHPVEYHVAPLFGGLGVGKRVVDAGEVDDTGQKRRLGERE